MLDQNFENSGMTICGAGNSQRGRNQRVSEFAACFRGAKETRTALSDPDLSLSNERAWDHFDLSQIVWRKEKTAKAGSQSARLFLVTRVERVPLTVKSSPSETLLERSRSLFRRVKARRQLIACPLTIPPGSWIGSIITANQRNHGLIEGRRNVAIGAENSPRHIRSCWIILYTYWL